MLDLSASQLADRLQNRVEGDGASPFHDRTFRSGTTPRSTLRTGRTSDPRRTLSRDAALSYRPSSSAALIAATIARSLLSGSGFGSPEEPC